MLARTALDQDSRERAAPTVLVCAQVRLYRDGLAEALARRPECDLVGTAATAADASALFERLRPEVVLADVSSTDGLVTMRALRGAAPGARVLALGVADDDDQILACAEAGVSGFLTRDTSLDELVAAIGSAVCGELACSPHMAAALLRRVGSLAAECRREPATTTLTPRQAEVLDLLEEGLSNKQIAAQLSIELATVKNHVHSILDRLHVTRRAEAVSLLRDGWASRI
jgi:two-component system nitrate/nitrite response regulator NarL